MGTNYPVSGQPGAVAANGVIGHRPHCPRARWLSWYLCKLLSPLSFWPLGWARACARGTLRSYTTRGKALVEHVVESALALAPAERIFVVVGHQADRVRHALASTGVGFIEQAEQKGTGHAVMAGREALAGLGGRLVVLYGDCPLLRPETLARLVETAAGGDAACVLLTAIMEDPTGYGRVVRGPGGRVTAIVEQKAASPEQLAVREANMGSTASARTCSGVMRTGWGRTIRPASTTSPTWRRF